MRPLQAHFHKKTKQMVNGQVVQDSEINSEYNGKFLQVDERDNNAFKHYTIDNKHLKALLSHRDNRDNRDKDLLERLQLFLGKTVKKKKNGRKKTVKRKMRR